MPALRSPASGSGSGRQSPHNSPPRIGAPQLLHHGGGTGRSDPIHAEQKWKPSRLQPAHLGGNNASSSASQAAAPPRTTLAAAPAAGRAAGTAVLCSGGAAGALHPPRFVPIVSAGLQ
jgi:hypothetical protein